MRGAFANGLIDAERGMLLKCLHIVHFGALDIITCWGTVAVAMSAAGPATVGVPVLGEE